MKNKISLIFLFGLLITLFSCKKEDPVADCDIQPSFNLPGKPGTRWIYQWYIVDSNDVETVHNAIDTIELVGDTMINGKSFHHFYGSAFPYSAGDFYRRDSSGYIVTESGFIVWNYQNDTTAYHQSNLGEYYQKTFMANGMFDVNVLGQDYSSFKRNQETGTVIGSDISPCAGPYVQLNSHYVEGIGEVIKETAYFAQLQQCERYRGRLIEFYEP